MPRPTLILAGVASLLAVGGPASAQQPPATTTTTPADGSIEAVAWLRVRPIRDGNLWGSGQGDYDAYRNTQAELILLPTHLNAALRKPGVAELESLRDEPDKVAWLRRTIQVTVPANSQIIRVSMRGTNAQDAKNLVDAVTRAYLAEAVARERADRLARRDKLEKKYKENMAEIRARLETHHNLTRALDARENAPDEAAEEMAALNHAKAELEARRNEIAQLQAVTNQMGIQLAALDADLTITDHVELIEPATVLALP